MTIAAMLLAWGAVVFAGLVLCAAFLGWLVSAARPARMLARLGARVALDALDAHVGKQVVIEGTLTAPAATFFPQRIQSIEDVDMRARPVGGPHALSLKVGRVEVALDGPVQVVLGHEERAREGDAGLGSIRRLAEGERVLAEGTVRRVAGTEADTYRDRAHAHALIPPPDDGWKDRPIGLYIAARPRRVVPAIGLAMASALLLLGASRLWSVTRAPVTTSVAARPPVLPRAACAAEVDALLDRNDPWAAKAALATCGDPRAAAETAWMLGDFEEASAAWRSARTRDPDAPVVVSEVEAAILANPKAGADVVDAMKADWYRGPRDKSQDALDCVTKELRAGGQTSLGCLAGRHNVYGWSAFGLHSMPNYALHDPGRYFRFQPLGLEMGQRCGSTYRALDDFSGRLCLAEIGVVRAIFAAVAGDAELLESELRRADALRADLASFAEHPPELDPDDSTEGSSPSEARVQLDKELRERTYDAQRSLAVAAAAAWVGHDDARARAYLPYVSAHERAILGEHLDLVAGKLATPDASHSPSDYSVLDMEMFAVAAKDDPAQVAKALEARELTAPTRLFALLASRPAHAKALAPWVERGFVKVCRTCGAYALLEGSFRRREAARLVGAHDLEARLLVVTRKIGRALGGAQPSPGAGAVASIESLVDDAR